MALKCKPPRLEEASLGIVRPLPKRADPHYLTTDWKALRERIFARDRFTCVVPGCHKRAVVCEHIISRRHGGTDDKSNLCSLCRDHDNRFKELPDGTRRNADEWTRIFGAGVGGLNPSTTAPSNRI